MELSPNATEEEIDAWNKRKLFVRDAAPDRWIDYSLELQQAAEILWGDRANRMEVTLLQGQSTGHVINRQLSNPRVYALLAGLALENSLKAQLIVKNPTYITDAKLQKPIKTHQLTELMDLIKDLEFDEDEKKLAAICEQAIPYWGRYPVPLDYRGVADKYKIVGNFHDEFVALNRRVRKHVHDKIKDGWDSGVGPKTLKIRSAEFDDDLEIDKPLSWMIDYSKDAL
jgi:hypothetical protein